MAGLTGSGAAAPLLPPAVGLHLDLLFQLLLDLLLQLLLLLLQLLLLLLLRRRLPDRPLQSRVPAEPRRWLAPPRPRDLPGVPKLQLRGRDHRRLGGLLGLRFLDEPL